MTETWRMDDDATRAADHYDAMGPAYADDVRTHPVNAAYERPAMLTMAGAHSSEAAAPTKMLLRVIRGPSGAEIGAVI